MHILLPPSETKRPGGGESALTLEHFADQRLTKARKSVLAALRRLSLKKREAMRVLKLSEKQVGYLDDNRDLLTAPTLPAIERYDGVLYDAIAIDQMDADARAWLDEHVTIQSALFGQISATDHIPAYRLSASTVLPGLKIAGKTATLKTFWQHAHDRTAASASDFVLDLRSKDYVALAPVTDGQPSVWVNVVSRAEDGTVRALNHFNKTAKGQLVRLLAETRPIVETVDDLLAWAAREHVECELDAHGQLTLVADSVSVKAGQPL